MVYIRQIADVEGPVHRDVVIERIRQLYGIGHVQRSTRESVVHAIGTAVLSGEVQGDETFIWIHDDQIRREPRTPVDRDIEHMPPYELKSIVVSVARSLFGVPRGDLITEVARRLTFQRTGSKIAEVLETAIQDLLTDGLLVESFGMLHAPVDNP